MEETGSIAFLFQIFKQTTDFQKASELGFDIIICDGLTGITK